MWDRLHVEESVDTQLNGPVFENSYDLQASAVSLLVDTKTIKSQTENYILQNREKLKSAEDSNYYQYLETEISKLEKLHKELESYLEELEYFADIEKISQNIRKKGVDPKNYITKDHKTLSQALQEKDAFLKQTSPLEKCDFFYQE